MGSKENALKKHVLCWKISILQLGLAPKNPFFLPSFPLFLDFCSSTTLLNGMIPAAGEEPSGSCQALSKQPRSLELLPAGSWNSFPLADNVSVIHALANRGVSSSRALTAPLTRSFVMQFPWLFAGIVGKAAGKGGMGGRARLLGRVKTRRGRFLPCRVSQTALGCGNGSSDGAAPQHFPARWHFPPGEDGFSLDIVVRKSC